MSKSKKNKSLSDKVSKLVREGYKKKQAVAIAHSMQRSGRLGPEGGYKSKKKGN